MAVYTDIHIDWENGEIVGQDIDETGAKIGTSPSFTLKLQDLEFAANIVAKFRRFRYDDQDGNAKRIYLLATKPEDADDDGHDDDDEDVILGGGSGSLNYRGTYDAAVTDYKKGDIVRVRSGDSQGVYVCVVDIGFASGAPEYPEPADTGGVNEWEIWALGIQMIDVCLGGSDTQLPVNIGT